MTEYHINERDGAFYIEWTVIVPNGMELPYTNGPYKSRDSAQRRIRKLRAAPIHVDFETLPSDALSNIKPIGASAWRRNTPDAIEQPQRRNGAGPVGVYPGISKVAHSRRAYG